MTEAPPPQRDAITTSSPANDAASGYITWLLEARRRSSSRNAVRYGGIDATADRAYPYLARFWEGTPWLKTPLLLHASAAATFSHIGQANGVSFGHLAKALRSRGVIQEETIGARLLAVQTMSLPNAHRLLSGLLHAADSEAIALDWASTWDTYRWWDQPNRKRRRITRRNLIESFYS